MDCKDCKDKDECVIYQEWLNTRDCCCKYAREEQKSRDDRYRKIFVEFNRYTKKDMIFLDNDGEVIKSVWDEMVNKNS